MAVLCETPRRRAPRLLNMAQIDAGVVEVKRESANLVDLIDAAIERAYGDLDGKLVSRDVPSDLPPVVLDRALTEAALANVFGNAAKYGPTHGRILVRAFRQNGSIVIEVLDEGPGFPAELLPHLFEKFARGVEDDGRPPGTGLGLATAKGFLTAQGGTIEAHNRTDRSGTCVRIVLPVTE